MLLRRLLKNLPLVAAVVGTAVYTTACCCCGPAPDAAMGITQYQQRAPEVAPTFAKATPVQAH